MATRPRPGDVILCAILYRQFNAAEGRQWLCLVLGTGAIILAVIVGGRRRIVAIVGSMVWSETAC